MSSIRLSSVAVVLSLLAGCLCTRPERVPTADELHELTLEQLLEIRIETVQRAAMDLPLVRSAPVPAAFGGGGSGGKAGESGSEGVDEYQLKAAFLGKFVKYVAWPPERLAGDDPLVVGVIGQDPFGDRLEAAFRSRKSGERAVTVRRFPGLDGIAAAHVLFVPAREVGRLAEILRATRAAGLLLIGESEDFAARGGVINFYLEDDKLRFEINTDSARRQRLKVSSDLLKLARIVGDKGMR